MIYGESDTPLHPKTLTKFTAKGIPIILHRRAMARATFIVSGPRPDPDDTLSAHLLRRANARTATHVARQLLKAKMYSMKYLVPPAELPDHADVNKLRNVEAVHARRYWDAWFAEIGHTEWHRRSMNPASATLDAISKFVSGITLRWITYHNLSPYHGFLHTPTDYPTLIYDLLEPYRGLSDFIVMQTLLNTSDEKDWIPHSVNAVKNWLGSSTYVPLTRQIVTHQELLHGIVLSLKYYLLGKQRKFHIPLPGKPTGGRPAKVQFKLYGRQAGKTDFWKAAHALSAEPHTVSPPTATPVRGVPTTQPAASMAARRRVAAKLAPIPADFCVIDIETSGLVPSNDHIIELGALRVRDWAVTGELSRLVKAPVQLNTTIRELTGLTDEMLDDQGADLDQALDEFTAFVDRDTLVGHNVNFDLRFIEQALSRCGRAALTPNTIDTRTRTRKLVPGLASYKLPDLAETLNLPLKPAHRALEDCKATLALLKHLTSED
jgi:DNA polymerase III epsilon subunit-like protein/CRISPR/Cas system-associated endonuclease Cas1